MYRRLGVSLLLAIFVGVTTWATDVVRWSVKVPVNYTVTSQTDFSDTSKRLHVLNNGANVNPYNFDSSDELVVTRDTAISSPEIKICNHTGSTQNFEFYNCAGGLTCTCPGQEISVITVSLNNGECYDNGSSAKCAKKL